MLKPRKPLVPGSIQAQDSVYKSNLNWDRSSLTGGKDSPYKKLTPEELKKYSASDDNVKRHGMTIKEVRIAKSENYAPGTSQGHQVEYDKPVKKTTVAVVTPKVTVSAKVVSKAKSEVPKMKTIPVKDLTAGKKTPELMKTKNIIGKPTDMRGLKVNKKTGNVKQTAISKLAEKTTGEKTFRRAAEIKVVNALAKKGVDLKLRAQKTSPQMTAKERLAKKTPLKKK